LPDPSNASRRTTARHGPVRGRVRRPHQGPLRQARSSSGTGTGAHGLHQGATAGACTGRRSKGSSACAAARKSLSFGGGAGYGSRTGRLHGVRPRLRMQVQAVAVAQPASCTPAARSVDVARTLGREVELALLEAVGTTMTVARRCQLGLACAQESTVASSGRPRGGGSMARRWMVGATPTAPRAHRLARLRLGRCSGRLSSRSLQVSPGAQPDLHPLRFSAVRAGPPLRWVQVQRVALHLLLHSGAPRRSAAQSWSDTSRAARPHLGMARRA
jgi:hypothetical protein